MQKEYKVKKGDTLWTIATKYLGDGSRYPALMDLNDLKSSTLQVGQVLKVPVQLTSSGYADLGRKFEIALNDIRKLKSVQDLIKELEG